jgi:hypothetical protein
MCRSCHFAYDGVSDMLRQLDHSYLAGNTHARGGGKLSEGQADEVRRLLATGMGLREVARQFGVGHSSIAKIRDGKTHLTEGC